MTLTPAFRAGVYPLLTRVPYTQHLRICVYHQSGQGMGVQFETVAYAAENSLTLIVDDIARQRRNGSQHSPIDQDLESWLNAFQRQSVPLIYSKQGQANLEAWLAEVELGAAAA